MSRKVFARTVLLGVLLLSGICRADVTLTLSSDDFAIASVYNNVANFNFSITLAGTIAPGVTYHNPLLRRVNYEVQGVLTQPTPSGFPGFTLRRDIDGADFYNLSPEAALSFTVSPTANLSDGLQLAELVGTSDVFYFNAREFNQTPGRYHPPILRLNSDATGSLANADNQSDVPNPPPPTGSGLLVDVAVGEEYNVILATDLPVDITEPVVPPRQVPLVATPMLLLLSIFAWRKLPTARAA